MLPAFVGGLPGGMELAVMFMILVSFAIVVFVVVAVGRMAFGGGSDDQRVAELEARVAELEAELAEERRDDDG
ncbi:homolog to Sec-independent protein translocase subunit TatA [Halobacterium hubeiense]|uniref:Homolog to Sec-independent protein translocase subunit TatA n=1 Tax=Halobacterium hubeiense TaxID=1407499 RepID=A0A0U5GY75_9EURY|nr:hypothetical protein [Halobacterium hubeiense]CQH49133.1 homolog to Sec-independent protein translocase subunit TatA [Halobacterium hubeiense]